MYLSHCHTWTWDGHSGFSSNVLSIPSLELDQQSEVLSQDIVPQQDLLGILLCQVFQTIVQHNCSGPGWPHMPQEGEDMFECRTERWDRSVLGPVAFEARKDSRIWLYRAKGWEMNLICLQKQGSASVKLYWRKFNTVTIVGDTEREERE